VIVEQLGEGPAHLQGLTEQDDRVLVALVAVQHLPHAVQRLRSHRPGVGLLEGVEGLLQDGHRLVEGREAPHELAGDQPGRGRLVRLAGAIEAADQLLQPLQGLLVLPELLVDHRQVLQGRQRALLVAAEVGRLQGFPERPQGALHVPLGEEPAPGAVSGQGFQRPVALLPGPGRSLVVGRAGPRIALQVQELGPPDPGLGLLLPVALGPELADHLDVQAGRLGPLVEGREHLGQGQGEQLQVGPQGPGLAQQTGRLAHPLEGPDPRLGIGQAEQPARAAPARVDAIAHHLHRLDGLGRLEQQIDQVPGGLQAVGATEQQPAVREARLVPAPGLPELGGLLELGLLRGRHGRRGRRGQGRSRRRRAARRGRDHRSRLGRLGPAAPEGQQQDQRREERAQGAGGGTPKGGDRLHRATDSPLAGRGQLARPRPEPRRASRRSRTRRGLSTPL